MKKTIFIALLLLYLVNMGGDAQSQVFQSILKERVEKESSKSKDVKVSDNKGNKKVFYDDEEEDTTIVQEMSIKELEKTAKGGDETAQLKLGYCYINGTDVKQNSKKAYDYFIQAAKQGNHEACLAIAKMIGQNRIEGLGLKDLYRWLNRAAKSNKTKLLLQVAEEYLRLSDDINKGADKLNNISNAFKIYDEVFENTKNIEIKKKIADIYQTHISNSSDRIKTMNLYKEIAELGDAEAQYIYGKYYYDIDDKESALPWLKKSYEQGYMQAEVIYLKCEKGLKQKRIEDAVAKKGREERLAQYTNHLQGYVFTTSIPFTDYEPTASILGLDELVTTEVVIFAIEKESLVYGLMTAIDRDKLPNNPSRGELLQLQLFANEYNRGTKTYDFKLIDDVFSFTEVYMFNGKETKTLRRFKYDKQKDMLYDVDHEIYLEKKKISEFR